ncbi:hypothetical protein H5T87_11110, partial [bacterium]|nr:hypothetical protein [bacterium]
MSLNWLLLILLLSLLAFSADQQSWGVGIVNFSWAPGAHRGELGKDVIINISDSTIEMRSFGISSAIVNSNSFDVLKGEVKFQYKAISSEGQDNLAVFVIPLDKNGRETSPGRAKFIIPKENIGDGKWHTATIKYDYLPFINVEKVLIAPRINESGVAGAGHLIVREITLLPAKYELAPRLVSFASTNRPLYLVGEKPRLNILIKNEGRKDSEEGIIRVLFRNTESEMMLPALKIGEEKKLSLELPQVNKAGLYPIKISLQAGNISSSSECQLVVAEDLHKKGISIELPNARLFFPSTPQGYGTALLQLKKGEKWQDVALIPSLFSLETESAQAEVFTKDYRKSRSGIVFRGRINCQVDWDFEVRYRVDFSTQQFVLSLNCTPTKDVPLASIRFPRIYVGERSFGELKKYALFPGLEFLKDEERSSSTRDANPPASDRWAPHPYKITIPLMAISSPDCTISLLWDENQKWDGENPFPSALFASPNFIEGGSNHLMSLFLPSIPKFVEENALRAEPPYPAKAGKSLSLTCRLSLNLGEDVLVSIKEWKKAFGFPKPKLPRSIEEEMELCATCYTDVIWSEEAFGWLPWTGVPHQLDVNVIHSLLKMANYIGNAGLKEKALSLAKRTLAKARPASSIEVAFRLGELEEALRNARSSAYDNMKSQGEDGSWVFHPDENRKNLGKEGETEIGICAPPAESILRWALISGDEEALKKGLLALKFMDRFYIPAGAQTWECPLHAPDIYASAVAIPPYLYAYEITKDKHYLERAKQMALAGIPFVYLWKAPDRPTVMQGATIPIFGATFFVLPWFARPVQWNGLAYAHSLRLLAKYDDSFPWKDIADLVLQSGMEQQATEGIYKGLYPDSYELIPNNPAAPWLAPILILRNLFYLSGDPLDIHFKVLDSQKGKVHITSGTRFQASIKESRITIETEKGDLPNSYLTIAGLPIPRSIKLNGTTLERKENIDRETTGWRYV